MKDKIIDIVALFVAICALALSIKQGNTQSKLEIINKQPLLCIEFIKLDSAAEKGFKIYNAGFGPAIITDFKIRNSMNEKRSYNLWLKKGQVQFSNPEYVYFGEINNLVKGFVLAPGKDSELFLLGTKTKTFYNTTTAQNMSNIVIEVKYESISYFDNQEYYLRFSESAETNNYRSSSEKKK